MMVAGWPQEPCDKWIWYSPIWWFSRLSTVQWRRRCGRMTPNQSDGINNVSCMNLKSPNVLCDDLNDESLGFSRPTSKIDQLSPFILVLMTFWGPKSSWKTMHHDFSGEQEAIDKQCIVASSGRSHHHDCVVYSSHIGDQISLGEAIRSCSLTLDTKHLTGSIHIPRMRRVSLRDTVGIRRHKRPR